jgi:hypothetical protein
VRIELGRLSEVAEIETVAAARIENDVAGRRVHHFGDGAQQRLSDAAIVQSPPPFYGRRGVTRLL